MSVSASRTRLTGLTKELTSQWQQAKDCWKDDKSREFEKKYIEELVTSLNRAISNMENLEKIVSKIRSDCE